MHSIYLKYSRISIGKDTNDIESSPVKLNNKETLYDFLKGWLDEREKKDISLFGYDQNQMETDFREFFYYLEAAGGVVFNQNNQVLFIYRSGIWDLPKGKIDKNEGVEHCALREVEEETGVTRLQIKEKLKPSYHIYWHKNKWYLKKTHWFFMETSSDRDLKPQLEEEITEVRWMNIDECNETLKKTYRSLRDSIGCEIRQYFEEHKK